MCACVHLKVYVCTHVCVSTARYTHLSLHHVGPLSSDVKDIIEDVDGAQVLNHLDHVGYDNQSSSSAHTSTAWETPTRVHVPYTPHSDD